MCVCGVTAVVGGGLVVYCLGQHLFTHSLTVWDAKELQWMNQPCCLLHISWLQDCGYRQDILKSIKTLCPRHKLADSTQAHYAYFLPCSQFFLPALRQDKWFACVSLTACLVSFLKWNKAEIIPSVAMSHYKKQNRRMSSRNTVLPTVAQSLGNLFVHLCRSTHTAEWWHFSLIGLEGFPLILKRLAW